MKKVPYYRAPVADRAKEFPVYPFPKRVVKYEKPIGTAPRPHIAASMIRIFFQSRYGIERIVYGIEIHFDGKAYYMPERKNVR